MDDDLLWLIGGIVFLIAIVGGICIALDAASCHAQFAGSALQSKYTTLGGCQVHDPKFGWIPSANFRSLGQ